MAIGNTNSAIGSGIDTSDADAIASDILLDKTAYVNGEKITGTIPSKAAATYHPSASNYTIPTAGYYCSGAQTLTAVTTNGITAVNIKNGVTVSVGDIGSATRIVGETTGTFASDGNVSAGQMLSGKIAYNASGKVTGNIATKTTSDISLTVNTYTVPAGYYASAVTKTLGTAQAATTYNVSTSDRTIASGTYLTGAQTIRAVTTSNIAAANIRYNVTVKVGDANDDDRIASATGTFSYTVSSGQSRASAAAIRSGYSAFVSGAEVKGTLANGSATTPATTITANPSISINSSGVVTATVSKTQSVTPTVSAGYISSGTAGTITVSGSATKTLTTKAATTWTPTTTNQTIAAGTYTTGVQTIKGDANLVAANILSGKSIFGVAGSAVVQKKFFIGTYTASTSSSTNITIQRSEITALGGTLASNLTTYNGVVLLPTATITATSETKKTLPYFYCSSYSSKAYHNQLYLAKKSTFINEYTYAYGSWVTTNAAASITASSISCTLIGKPGTTSGIIILFHT